MSAHLVLDLAKEGSEPVDVERDAAPAAEGSR